MQRRYSTPWVLAATIAMYACVQAPGEDITPEADLTTTAHSSTFTSQTDGESEVGLDSLTPPSTFCNPDLPGNPVCSQIDRTCFCKRIGSGRTGFCFCQ
jgi:hypothetical protein